VVVARGPASGVSCRLGEVPEFRVPSGALAGVLMLLSVDRTRPTDRASCASIAPPRTRWRQ
jgi:hypothetical protein